MTDPLSHLTRLEAESIHIFREAVAETRNLVMLFLAGKDSTVLGHLGLRAFHPAKSPFPLLNIDSTWEFQSLLDFRDAFAKANKFELVVRANEAGRASGINPFDHGDYQYTTLMRTDPLKAALGEGDYDIIVSVRGARHSWDPHQQRPELWQLYNLRLGKDRTVRVFPLSNWTELDVWSYALLEGIELAPLYFAAPRQIVAREGALIVVDDERRMRFQPGATPTLKSVRFRTLGCRSVTGAFTSAATTLAAVVQEPMTASAPARQGRISDQDSGGSIEQQQRQGYF